MANFAVMMNQNVAYMRDLVVIESFRAGRSHSIVVERMFGLAEAISNPSGQSGFPRDERRHVMILRRFCKVLLSPGSGPDSQPSPRPVF